MKNIMLLVMLALAIIPTTVLAVDFGGDISSQDKQAFDKMLEPVMKVYNFIKYSATVIAVVFLVFAGVTFVISGSDQAKREQAKTMAMYVVIGLIVIWVAPLIVNYIVG